MDTECESDPGNESEEVEHVGEVGSEGVVVEHDPVAKTTSTESEIIEPPKTGMLFGSSEDLFNYYNNYGNQEGFQVLKRSTRKDDDGNVRFWTFTCARAGKSQLKKRNILDSSLISKTGCPAKVNASLCLDGRLKINSVILEHNHSLSPGKARFFWRNRKVNERIKRRLVDVDQSEIGVAKSSTSLVVQCGGYENVLHMEKDSQTSVEKARQLWLRDGGAEALCNYFKRMQSLNSNFFYLMDLDEEGCVRNVFWADARSRLAYQSFGDVVTFDTTYLTNEYNVPFTPFVGVNHHGHSILLGCGLVSNETIQTFVWLFRAWLECMSNRAPNAIITDQHEAIGNAIQIVFPNTRHRWCVWLLMKKMSKKLKGCPTFESINTGIQNAIYDSTSEDEFERSWSKLIGKYGLENNEWLGGLYKERHRWVPTYVKDAFWAGMSTTQRSESIRAFFDGYVNSRTTLKQFVEHYDSVLRRKVEKENLEDYKSFNCCHQLITKYKFEAQFQEVYTNAKFLEFQQELKEKMYCEAHFLRKEGGVSIFDVEEATFSDEGSNPRLFTVCFNEGDRDVRCICRLFEHRGILCRHVLALLSHLKIYSVSSKCILDRWRKDLKRDYTKVKISYNVCNDSHEMKRYDELCNVSNEINSAVMESKEKSKMVMDFYLDLMNKIKRI